MQQMCVCDTTMGLVTRVACNKLVCETTMDLVSQCSTVAATK